MLEYLEDYKLDIRKHKTLGVFDNAAVYKSNYFHKDKGCGRYDRSAAPKQRTAVKLDRRSHRRSRSRSTAPHSKSVVHTTRRFHTLDKIARRSVKYALEFNCRWLC